MGSFLLHFSPISHSFGFFFFRLPLYFLLHSYDFLIAKGYGCRFMENPRISVTEPKCPRFFGSVQNLPA
ncbi:unnamed protein product [Meloidogyne enterolobii]|uniref:Uncharacterized protein n=1 Tax=Meloidogyne enterolobii TaxID=390850 RepID=A0ACB0YIC8_MELEN